MDNMKFNKIGIPEKLKEIKHWKVVANYENNQCVGYLEDPIIVIDENGYFNFYSDQSFTELLFLPKPDSIIVTPIYA